MNEKGEPLKNKIQRKIINTNGLKMTYLRKDDVASAVKYLITKFEYYINSLEYMEDFNDDEVYRIIYRSFEDVISEQEESGE